MSRTKAKKCFKLADPQAQTEGVECRKDDNVIAEIPGAHKDIDAVMANQTDLVDVVHTLKQVVCMKGWQGFASPSSFRAFKTKGLRQCRSSTRRGGALLYGYPGLRSAQSLKTWH